ncbi:MAG TPA: FtsX-like permease family protein [Terriglobales bacterium]|nr:FtsX-like permease family protein [Terriglobales bacterium]
MKVRRKGPSMFLRMLWRAAVLRKRTALSALLAITVAAAAATAMLNLFVDVQAKLRKEFRGFGANIVMEAKAGESFSAADLTRIASTVGNRALAVPFGYAVAHTESGESVVVAGTDLDLVRRLNPWWSVSSWPAHTDDALVGVTAAPVVTPNNSRFALSYQGRALQLTPAGTVRTGAGEASRVYISLNDFESWTGLQPSVVEIAAYGSATEVTSLLSTLQRNLPNADVHPVRQVTEGEANILSKTRSTLLWSSVFIISTAALCVLATLTGWLFDRRRDFAIMKAIGASDRTIALFISGEAAVLAFIGGLFGYLAGIGIAAWIGRANFNAAVSPRLDVLPPVLIGSIAVTLLATLLPLRLLRQIQPAMILRGE